MTTRSSIFQRLPATLLALTLFAVCSLFALPRAASAAPSEPVESAHSSLQPASGKHAGALLAPRAAKVHVAPAAMLDRLPPFATASAKRGAACISYHPSLERTLGPGVQLGHFHGQRRIPRMNSDEPPRR